MNEEGQRTSSVGFECRLGQPEIRGKDDSNGLYSQAISWVFISRQRVLVRIMALRIVSSLRMRETLVSWASKSTLF